MRFQGKVALITGAGSGMGRATALAFAREGARVACADIDAASAEATTHAIERGGGKAVAIPADVTRAADVQQMVDRTVAAWQRLDVLFNNAGIPQAPMPIEEMDEAIFDRIMAVNVKGVYLGCRYAVPVMKRQGGGVILNTASTAAVRPRSGLSIYNASKGAVVTLIASLALELAPHRIRVVGISPVVTDTPMLPAFTGTASLTEGARQALIATIPMGRLAAPEDVAGVALFLASDAASMITGSCIPVDGGRLA